MTIRITTQMTSNLLTSNINKNLSDIYDVYNQITSKKKFSSVGENPTDGTKVMKYNTQLGQLGDWSKNIASARDELSMSYDTMGLINENLERINDLAIQASSSTNSPESLEAIKNEIKSRTETITQLANTKYQDKYIFSGTNTSTQPFKTDDDLNTTYEGTKSTGDWQRNMEISSGTTIAVNVNGEDVFGDGIDGIFGTLKALNDAIEAPDTDFRNISACLDPLQAGIKNVTSHQAVISSRVQTLDTTKSINDDVTLGLKERRSDLQDTDYAEAATQLMMYQTALQASMQAGASIMQQASLLNYI